MQERTRSNVEVLYTSTLRLPNVASLLCHCDCQAHIAAATLLKAGHGAIPQLGGHPILHNADAEIGDLVDTYRALVPAISHSLSTVFGLSLGEPVGTTSLEKHGTASIDRYQSM